MHNKFCCIDLIPTSNWVAQVEEQHRRALLISASMGTYKNLHSRGSRISTHIGLHSSCWRKWGGECLKKACFQGHKWHLQSPPPGCCEGFQQIYSNKFPVAFPVLFLSINDHQEREVMCWDPGSCSHTLAYLKSLSTTSMLKLNFNLALTLLTC